MSLPRPGWIRSVVEGLLWTTAALCLGSVIYVLGLGAVSRVAAQAIVPPASLPSSTAAASHSAVSAGTVMARLEIPDLKLSVPVVSGIDPESLQRGVGHIAGTAMPGGLGTIGLAGHRDTYLRALRNITLGMDIRLADTSGIYHYTVDSTEIVSPEQVGVLDIQSRPELTLITCFPFNYIGAAPKRFIVHAHLNSVDPDQHS